MSGSPDPARVDVWIGLDVGKESHFAEVCDDEGEILFARGVRNDEAEIAALLDEAAVHGHPALVIDQPGSIGQLALAVAGRQAVPVAYIPGQVMRRAADLYPGESKTDPLDAHVLADTARTRRSQIHWLEATDELLEQLRVLNGFDADLAADATRISNRLRDALTSVSPALERALGNRLAHRAVRSGVCSKRFPRLPRSRKQDAPASAGSSRNGPPRRSGDPGGDGRPRGPDGPRGSRGRSRTRDLRACPGSRAPAGETGRPAQRNRGTLPGSPSRADPGEPARDRSSNRGHGSSLRSEMRPASPAAPSSRATPAWLP